MTLHLVRLPVDLRALATYAVANGVSDDDGGYALHHALRARFSGAGPQPFRFFPEQAERQYLLGYSPDADALADAAALPVADPLLRAVFAAAPEMQPMPAAWRTGARYAFEVRVRPVVRYGKTRRAARAEQEDAWQRRAGEVDAFVAACERAGEGVPVDREAVYLDWLSRQLTPAAVIEQAELTQLRRVRTRRSSHGRPGAKRVEGPDALIAGTLALSDPAAFAQVLARGVGRHAAFGFGMLLLSAARRTRPDRA